MPYDNSNLHQLLFFCFNLDLTSYKFASDGAVLVCAIDLRACAFEHLDGFAVWVAVAVFCTDAY